MPSGSRLPQSPKTVLLPKVPVDVTRHEGIAIKDYAHKEWSVKVIYNKTHTINARFRKKHGRGWRIKQAGVGRHVKQPSGVQREEERGRGRGGGREGGRGRDARKRMHNVPALRLWVLIQSSIRAAS